MHPKNDEICEAVVSVLLRRNNPTIDPWLFSRLLRCLALPRVPGSIGTALPTLDFGALRVLVPPSSGYTVPWTLGVPYCLDGGLVVGEYGIFVRGDVCCLYVDLYLQC